MFVWYKVRSTCQKYSLGLGEKEGYVHVCFPFPNRLGGSGTTENVEISASWLGSALTGLTIMKMNGLPG